MKKLYDSTSVEISTLITKNYSTSFSIGIRTLDKDIRGAIYSIYGFVRLADEIVDTFFGFDQEKMLKQFVSQTYESIEDKISVNPVLNSFQKVVNEYGIDISLIEAFLHSMALDLSPQKYEKGLYEEYIYGSAEVVGLMCLQVFCFQNPNLYVELKDTAKSLGAAFQKVNFLRDIQSDFGDRGRVYFPGVDMNSFSKEQKIIIEQDIYNDFKNALIGINKLPKTSKAGVLLAYRYYFKLFEKIKKTPASEIMKARIRVGDNHKLFLFLGTYFQSRLNIL